MDSGNSGSLQSSSGGDDEFDSRGGGGGVDSSPLSALLRPSPSPSAAAFSLHGSYFGLQEFTSAPPPQQQQQQAGAWSGSFAGASGLSSSSSPRVAQAEAGAGARTQGADAAVAAAAQGQGAGMAGAPAPAQPPRGSRKRTRASRRAPTTVLTTDTSNFRAMVQEFTGIPSPPFGAGVGVGVGGPAASLRTRFDHIFPPPSSLRSAAGGAAADAASLPPYLLRPFPHKLPTVPSSFPPFTASSSSASSSTPSSSNIGAANANAATGAATTAAASSNPAAAQTAAGDAFQQLTSSALLRLQQDPSSFLSFQNLLDSHPSSQSIFGGFGQSSRMHDPAPSPSDFLAGVGSGSHSLITHGGLMGSEGMHLHHSRGDVHGHGHGHGHGGDELSGVVAAGASGGSCKLNYSSHTGAVTSSSAAGAGADKPPDGAPGRPGRGDGLDPWICTSE